MKDTVQTKYVINDTVVEFLMMVSTLRVYVNESKGEAGDILTLFFVNKNDEVVDKMTIESSIWSDDYATLSYHIGSKERKK